MKFIRMSEDSLTFARRLKSNGFTEQQAKALADATRDIFGQNFTTSFAAVANLAALEQWLTLRIGVSGLIGPTTPQNF